MPDSPPEQRPGIDRGTVTAVSAEELSAAGGANRAAAASPSDVWSWTESRYRKRAVALLFVNLLLYCGLCAFTHWLHVARLFEFEWSSYVEPLRFWGPQTQNLYDFVLFPISVDQTPIHGIVIGLLMAAIVAVPISVSLLYRLAAALPFCAAVFVFAHMPWMAITLAGSCILAAVRPFRMSFRYGSALLAMLPVLLYLYLATRGAAESMSASIPPERKLLQNYPWLLAILAACTMLALIIFIARIVHYRPGAVAPVIAVMFATPAILFHLYVGADQLTYRLLEADYGPRSPRFEPVQDATEAVLDLVRRRAEHGIDHDAQMAVLQALSSERPAEQLGAIRQRIAQQLLIRLLKSRHRAYDACRGFIADYPTSRYVPAVLFIQARALDTRLDEVRFLGDNVRRELYTDFPHVQSEPVWARLLTQYPDTPWALAAGLRVAQLRLRKGDAGGALAALNSVDAARRAVVAGRREPGRKGPVGPAGTALDFEPEPYLFEIDRLRELIEHNAAGGDPAEAVQPLQALAALDPHRPGYRDQLRRLASQYAGTRLHDNLVERWAGAATDRAERARLLEAYVAMADQYRDRDALPEALFELGDLEVQPPGVGAEKSRERGIARFQTIVDEHGGTCWARLAAERLLMLVPQSGATQPAGGP